MDRSLSFLVALGFLTCTFEKKKEKLCQDNLVLLICAKYSDHWMFFWAVMATDGHIFIFLVTFFALPAP